MTHSPPPVPIAVPVAREALDRAGPERTSPSLAAPQVAVVGPRECTERQAAHAREVGERLARAGAVVICGGGSGVMAAVAAGASSAGGLVVGIRPGQDREGASPDLSVTIVTNLGEARNAVIAWSADAVIAVGGSWGTLSEIALARRRGEVPVVVLEGWRVLDENGQEVPGFIPAQSPEEAVRLALKAL